MFKVLLTIVNVLIIITALYLGWVIYEYNIFNKSQIKYKDVYHPNYHNSRNIYDNTGYSNGYDYAKEFQYHQQQKFKEDEMKSKGQSRNYQQSKAYSKDKNANTIPTCFIELGFDTIPTDKAKVKDKYRQLAKVYHPDLNEGNDIKFKEINKHYNEALKYFK